MSPINVLHKNVLPTKGIGNKMHWPQNVLLTTCTGYKMCQLQNVFATKIVSATKCIAAWISTVHVPRLPKPKETGLPPPLPLDILCWYNRNPVRFVAGTFCSPSILWSDKWSYTIDFVEDKCCWRYISKEIHFVALHLVSTHLVR